MAVTIRAASAVDQAAISALVRAAHLNPFDLHWPQFLVAEAAGRIVGAGQVRCHRDGSRELASIVVAREYWRHGIGSALICALLERERPPLYLLCVEAMEAYYQRFGFQPVARAALPRSLARSHRFGSFVVATLSRLRRRPVRLIAMQLSAKCEVLPSIILYSYS